MIGEIGPDHCDVDDDRECPNSAGAKLDVTSDAERKGNRDGSENLHEKGPLVSQCAGGRYTAHLRVKGVREGRAEVRESKRR
jgi:hypothetical protein